MEGTLYLSHEESKKQGRMEGGKMQTSDCPIQNAAETEN